MSSGFFTRLVVQASRGEPVSEKASPRTNEGLRSSAQRLRREYRNHRRARALIRLVEKQLPVEREVTGDSDAWPLVGAALLSRMTTTMRSIFALHWRCRAVDVGTLVRSLYEHLVHLAWLAACPSAARIEEWRKDDLESRLTADNDARQRGVNLLEDSERAQLQAQVATMTGNKLVLVNLTEACDKHWAGKLPGMHAANQRDSFRGFYAFLYRQYSGTAHPTYRGINPVVEDVTATRKRIILENPFQGRGPYGMATVLFGLALFIAARSLEWPSEDRVTAAFERHPAAP